jgi:membrane protease YdiL (CAAX protease family)
MAASVAAAACATAHAGEETQSMPGTSWWTLAAWCAAALAAIVVVRRASWFRLLPRVGPAWPLRAEPSVIAFGASFLLAAVGGTATLAAFGVDEADPLRTSALQGLGGHAMQLAVVIAAFAWPGARTRGATTAVGHGGVHRHPCGHVESALLALAVALLAWPVAQAAGGLAGAVELWLGGTRPALGHRTLEAMSASGSGNPWLWLAVASATVLAPLAEEFTYRGLLQQGLKATGLPTAGAIALTSVLFALVHWSVLTDGSRASGLAVLFTLSVAWGLLYERTGRIAAPALAHAAFNAANLVIAAG